MKENVSKTLLGAHIPSNGGLDLVFKRAESIGINCLQLFTKNNRQWNAPFLTDEQITSFKKAHKESSIKTVFAHATYLINIGSPDNTIRTKSVSALILELERCSLLEIPYLILHPGSRLSSQEEICLDRIAQSLTEVFSVAKSNTIVLLETMAGQGTSIGYTFEQLAIIYENTTQKNRLGICLDTCHVYAAGYDFTTSLGYESMWQSFDTYLGRSLLKAIHFNDSKKQCGSRVDRHAKIGEGFIGTHAFSFFMNDPYLKEVAKILETPWTDSIEEYIPEITLLKNQIKKA